MSELSDHLTRAGLPAEATTARLAGLTNVNHLVTIGDDRCVLRIPGEGTSEYINRVDEEIAARSAAAAGVNAEVVFFDAADGLMVTRFIDGAATMSAERFRDLGAVDRAGHAFRQLHTTADKVTNTRTLSGLTDFVYAVAFSPDGTKVAGGSFAGEVAVWEVRGKGDKPAVLWNATPGYKR